MFKSAGALTDWPVVCTPFLHTREAMMTEEVTHMPINELKKFLDNNGV
jgi:hypothetical protein